jgi:hypothetical protein
MIPLRAHLIDLQRFGAPASAPCALVLSPNVPLPTALQAVRKHHAAAIHAAFTASKAAPQTP